MRTRDDVPAASLFTTATGSTTDAASEQADSPDATPQIVAAFVNQKYGIIGRTVSTKFEPNTSSQFLFWLADRSKSAGVDKGTATDIEIGNIVVASSEDHKELTFGTVVEMRSYSDVDSFIADYLSHNFGDAAIELPTDLAEVVVVTCNVMRNLSGKTRPVGSARVFFPSRKGIQFAFGVVSPEGDSLFAGAGIPIGVFENGDHTIAPVEVDENFLVGPEGAHLNVSGISGLASKTSAVEFILRSLFDHTQKRLAVVMFNVKSKDLLYVDQPNPRALEDDWSRNAYEQLNISTAPFTSAQFFAPQHPKDPQKTQSRRTLPTKAFEWDLKQISRDIPSLFEQDDWDDKMEGAWYRVLDEIDHGKILSYNQMIEWLNKTIQNAPAGATVVLGTHIATWHKLLNRLRGFPKRFPGLIQSMGNGTDIPWNTLKKDAVFVIDIEMLSDRGKKLVFGRAIRELSQQLENAELPLDGVVIFVDELNKFAPSGNTRSPLKNRLVDITARGRSIGLILFGAEQFASSVEREIVENSSTYLFGRTEANELRTPNYSGFSDEVKAKLMMLAQGHLLAKSAKYPQPVFLKFPFPTCLPGDQYKA